jgi:hypothetical protein
LGKSPEQRNFDTFSANNGINGGTNISDHQIQSKRQIYNLAIGRNEQIESTGSEPRNALEGRGNHGKTWNHHQEKRNISAILS